MLDQVVGHGDVRRAQLRGDLRLANQARARFGIGVERGGEELEGHATTEAGVFREVDITHAAAAEAFDDAVLEDGRSEKACAARHDSIIVPRLWRPSSGGWASGARLAWSSASRSAAASSARPLSIADARARSGLHAGRLGARGPDRALRRARLRGAVGRDARNRRHVRLPARRMGPPLRISLRLGAARPHPRRGAWRHLVGVRRVLPARVRHRSGGASSLGRLPRRRRHRLRLLDQHRRRPARRAVRRHLDGDQVRRARLPRRGVLRPRRRRRREHRPFRQHRCADRCRPLRPRAHLGDVGLRRLRGPDLRQRRGDRSAAQPAARHHLRHARHHRDLPARRTPPTST